MENHPRTVLPVNGLLAANCHLIVRFPEIRERRQGRGDKGEERGERTANLDS
jgi:hypothetical protein